MTLQDLIDQRFSLEGRVYREPPGIDQPTGPGGVTLPTLTSYRGRPCTVADLKALTLGEAALIIAKSINTALTQYGYDQIPYEPLRVQMLDYAYNSGPDRAMRWLQRTLGLTGAIVDGKMGPRTATALVSVPSGLLPAINNALAAERAHAAWNGGVADPAEQAGVAKRALTFVVVLS